MKRLARKFFCSHPKDVAPKLLGKYLVAKTSNREIVTKIVETEAYGGDRDLGCHIGRFGKTEKTKVLFGKVGCLYIYPVHINTYCLNIVCHKADEGGGILIRALEPISGIDLILKNLGKSKDNCDLKKLLNGPGKLCKALNINKTLNEEDAVAGDKIYLLEGERIKEEMILATRRINIPYAGISKDWLWRFIIKDSPFLSRPLDYLPKY